MSRPELTLTEAVAATGRSRRSLRRLIDADELPGARQDRGRWVVPAAALEAAGLRMNAPSPPDPVATPDVLAQVDALTRRAEQAEHRAAVAEAVSAERGAALEDLRGAMRMLEAGPRPVVEPVKPRWWRRGK